MIKKILKIVGVLSILAGVLIFTVSGNAVYYNMDLFYTALGLFVGGAVIGISASL